MSFSKLSRSFPMSCSDLLSAKEVAAILAERVLSKEPTSLLRYGDTSGRIIARPSQESDDYAYIKRFFGQSVTPERVNWLASQIEKSVHSADILGLRSDLLGPMFPRELLLDSDSDLLANLRSLYPIREIERTSLNRDGAKRLSETRVAMEDIMFSATGLFTDAWIHVGLLEIGFYSALFNDCTALSLCTSSVRNQSVAVLEEHLGSRFRFFECPAYPWEETCIGRDPQTLWRRWEILLDEMRPQEQGEVLLIAAGVWTKAIAGRWKQNGGIVIDIGSVMDYFELQGTRPAVLKTRYNSTNVPEEFALSRQLEEAFTLDRFTKIS